MNPRNVLPPANTGGWVASRRTARNRSRIKAGDFSPGAVSTPDNTSTAHPQDTERSEIAGSPLGTLRQIWRFDP